VNLTNLLKVEPKKEHTVAEIKEEINQPYTPEQLRAAWDEFAEQRKKFQAEYQLLQQPYDLIDNQIIIHIHHPVQDTMLNNLRIELSTFIREKLNNSLIQISGETKIAADDKKKLFTNRDKFDFLIEKNPVLKEMKDRLGLDTDF
jgi:hypothetical protein